MTIRQLLHSHYRWVVVLGVLGLALTGYAYRTTQEQERERLGNHFEHLAQERVLRLQTAIDGDLDVQLGIAGYFDANEKVTREAFARLVSPLLGRHPHILAINWAPRVPSADRQALEATLRAEGLATRGIFDVDRNALNPRPATERPVYFPLVYSEPLARNREAIGLDPYARPTHTPVMDSAWREGKQWSSTPFPLVQDPEGSLAVAIYLPVFEGSDKEAEASGKTHAPRGFVILILRLDALLDTALKGVSSEALDLRILDASRDDRLVHHRPGILGSGRTRTGERLATRLPLAMPGQNWVAVLTATEDFYGQAGGRQALMALAAGLGGTTLICLLLGNMAYQTQRQSHNLQRIEASETRLRQAFETNTAVKLIIDPADGRIVDANSAAVSFYGYDRPTLLAMRISDINTLSEAEVKAEMARARDAQRLYFSFRHRLFNGDIRDVEVYSGPIETPKGRLLYSIIHDVTDRMQAERALRESEARFRQLAENVDSIFWVGSPDWRRVYYINPAYERIWGRDPARLLASGMDWLDAVVEEDRPLVLDQIPTQPQADWQSMEFPPYRIRRPDGGIRWISARAFAVRDENGKVARVAGVADDITERQEHEHHLRELAHYDALTHLPNRLLLADRMSQALARGRRSGQLLATCMMDLDGFKPINDRLGHEAGDKLLIQVAQRLREGVRGDDTVARLGGDEFVLLLGGLDNVTEVEEALRRLLDLVAEPYQLNGQQASLSASFGVTLFPHDAGDPDTLIRHADHAMYLAKQAGKNRYHLFNPLLEKRERENRQALRLISRAIDENELKLHYQPVVDSRQGQVVAVEALLRWQHPILGLLRPAEFLPLVESDPELGPRMGGWVLRQALTQLRSWRQEGLDLSVSVNVFAHQLHDPAFPDQLESLLREFSTIPGDRLTLEILETAALEDMGSVARLIQFSERLGVKYALDDFGTGYSSLTYLRRLPVHSLKIDQSFVRDMLHDPEDMTIVEGIIGLATAFRHRVVAEGVETTDHALMLMEMGCPLVQGYGIAKPMSPEDTTAWLRAFQPDPRWLANASKRLARDDHQLVLAEVHHRQWLTQLLNWGRTEAGNRGLPPPQDSQACNFGRWYHGEGAKRYQHLPHYREVGPVHEKMHELANSYILRVEAGDTPEAQALETELRLQRNLLLDQLSRLRTAVMYEDVGQ